MAKKTANNEKLTYTPIDSTKVTGIGVSQTYQMLKQGVIPHIRVGSRYLIPKQALLRWLESCGRAE